MAHFIVLGHTLKSGVKVVTGGGIKCCLADLAIHFILELVEVYAGLAMHFKLKLNKQKKILFLLFGVIFDKLSQSLAFNIFGDDRPFTVNCRYLQNLRDREPRFFDTSLI